MGRILWDGQGAVRFASIVIGTGIVSICVLVAIAPSTEILASPTAEPRTAIAPTSDGALQLTDTVALPVGSVVVHSAGAFTSFELPTGGWLDTWGSHDGIPAGSVLTSPETFTTNEGQMLDAARFSLSITEAYSSQVKYAFK